MHFLKFKRDIGLLMLLFVVFSSHAFAEDTRTPVLLNEVEHDFVLAEMRGFVESLQLVMTGLAEGDMQTVAKAAKLSGKSTSNKAPRSLGTSFPPTFAKLGGETHQLWDILAAEAEDMGDKHEIQDQLSVLLNNCVACHATYRLVRN